MARTVELKFDANQKVYEIALGGKWVVYDPQEVRGAQVWGCHDISFCINNKWIKQSELFATKEEAQAECDRRNKNGL